MGKRIDDNVMEISFKEWNTMTRAMNDLNNCYESIQKVSSCTKRIVLLRQGEKPCAVITDSENATESEKAAAEKYNHIADKTIAKLKKIFKGYKKLQIILNGRTGEHNLDLA